MADREIKYKVIKKTRSISPLTCDEIDAQVILEDSKVYLLKTDEEGKVYKFLMEKDYDYYKMMTSYTVDHQVPAVNLDLYVSSVCNSSCPICYEKQDTSYELSVEDVRRLLRGFKGRLVTLSGMEPTCNKDLFKMISIISERNNAYLLTNGLKLADYFYTIELKNSGLRNVFLSFNGFKDDIYKQMNGRPMLAEKMKALSNIKKAGMRCVLSVTLVRGINENQIKPIFDYVYDNRSFINQLRFRSHSPVGRHLESEPFCPSEMIEMIAGALNLNKEDIFKECSFWHEYFRVLKSILPPRLFTYWLPHLCTAIFHIKVDKGRIVSVGSLINLDRIKKSRLKPLVFVFTLYRIFGFRFFIDSFNFLFNIPNFFRNKKFIRVIIKSWPNIYNIDLQENLKCPSQYYKNGRWLPFCYHNIIESGKSVQ